MFQAQTQDGFPISVPYSFNGYNICKFLGCGSTSIVVLVENQNTGQKFSAKILSKQDIEKRHLNESVEKEINVLRSLDHPSIIKIYDVFEICDQDLNGYIVMIMEYCENGDLLTFALNHKFESENQKKKIIIEFLDAVKYLHNKGISHGDIKAENILLDENLIAKLCDFGYTRTSVVAGNESKNGTLYYAAPELFRQGKFDTLKTDIWAIGVTLYSLSELQFPFKDGDQKYIINQIVTGKLSIRPEIDFKLRRVVERCTQMDPKSRPTIFDLIKDEYFYIEDESKDNNFEMKMNSLSNINEDDQWYEEIPYGPTFDI